MTVEARTPEGEDVRIEAEGLEARVLQHEIDHLDGVLIIDRTTPEQRRRSAREAPASAGARAVRRVKLAVAATAPFGAAVLEGLAKRHDVELLLTRPDRPSGRGRSEGSPPAKEAAERLGIPVEQPERLERFPGTADTVVVVAYGLLIPRASARASGSG